MKPIEELARKCSCFIGELAGMKTYFGWGDNKQKSNSDFEKSLNIFRKRSQGAKERNKINE